jgi:hypothetical protein
MDEIDVMAYDRTSVDQGRQDMGLGVGIVDDGELTSESSTLPAVEETFRFVCAFRRWCNCGHCLLLTIGLRPG